MKIGKIFDCPNCKSLEEITLSFMIQHVPGRVPMQTHWILRIDDWTVVNPDSGGSRHFVWGGHEVPKAPRSSAEGARIEAPKAPRGVGRGEGHFFNLLLKNGVFWSILMSKCASHV